MTPIERLEGGSGADRDREENRAVINRLGLVFGNDTVTMSRGMLEIALEMAREQGRAALLKAMEIEG